MSGIYGGISVNPDNAGQHLRPEMDTALRGQGSGKRAGYYKKFGQITAEMGYGGLGTLDLDSNLQVISNENQDIWVIMDGVIYNFSQLRKELQGLGHRFHTNTNAECIVHSYEAYGEACLQHLEGEFSLAVWDERHRSLLLARDRLGTKPLLYVYENGRFSFASDFNSILSNTGIEREVNLLGLHHYLSYAYVPAPHTAFKGIFKLLPAHQLIFRQGKIRIERYWDLDFSTQIKVTEVAAQERIIELFSQAIKKRLVGQRRLGAFLSGGTDSSAVIAIMSRMTAQPVKTFSIGFTNGNYDESIYAKNIVKAFNTEHHEYVVKPEDLEVLPKLVQYYGEPFADSSSLPSYYLAKLAREDVEVVLSGDGGDELFAGYQRYWASFWAENYRRLPELLKKKIAPWLLRYFPAFKDPKNSLGRLQRFLEAAALPTDQRYLYWTGTFSPSLKEQLYSAEFKSKVAKFDSVCFIQEALARVNVSDIVHSAMYVDTILHLHNDSNVKVDIASRANSLEVRAPLMDEELFNFVSQLPSNFKLRGNTLKYIFKKAIVDFVPRQNIYRRKMGFAVPIHSWFRKEAKGILCDTLLAQRCLMRGYFRPEMIRYLVDEHILGRKDYSAQLWALLILELWHRHFIDNS